MKSSTERNKSKKSGYAVVESIIPSLIAPVPAVRVEKHKNVVSKRNLDSDFENYVSLPCFLEEEQDKFSGKKAVEVTSRNPMTSKASTEEDFSHTFKPGMPKMDHAPAKGKYEMMYDIKKDGILGSKGIQSAPSHIPLSRDSVKEEKQVKFKPFDSDIAHDNDEVTSYLASDYAKNIEDDMDHSFKVKNESDSSRFFNSNSCSWKKPYDPSDYKEMSSLSENHVYSAEQVDSTTFHWGKDYDPLQFKDMDKPGNSLNQNGN